MNILLSEKFLLLDIATHCLLMYYTEPKLVIISVLQIYFNAY